MPCYATSPLRPSTNHDTTRPAAACHTIWRHPAPPSRTYFVIEDCVLLQMTGRGPRWPGGKRSPRTKGTSPIRPAGCVSVPKAPPRQIRPPGSLASRRAAGLIAEPRRRASEEPGLLGGGGLHPGDQRRVRLLHHGQVEALGAAGGVHAVHLDDAPLLPAAPCLGELQVQAAP